MKIYADDLTDSRTLTEDEGWVISKPLTYRPILVKLKEVWDVFTGKALAIYFKDDR